MTAPAQSAPPDLNNLGLTGAAVIVTGAGSGIGAATAAQLGAAGASVVLVGRRPEALEAVASSIRPGPGQAVCVQTDLAKPGSPGSPGKVTQACLERFGRIDGLVNNAAVVRHMPLAEWTVEGFDEHVATNVRAPFFLIQTARPALRESRHPGQLRCPGPGRHSHPRHRGQRSRRGLPLACRPGSARPDWRPG